MKQISKTESDQISPDEHINKSSITVTISTIGTELHTETRSISYVAHYVMNYLGLYNTALSLCMVDDDTMRTFNRDYRNIDAPTDVLSFSQIEGKDIPDNILLGDVVCAPAYIQRQAAKENILYTEELFRCIIHGILHLNGMDHAEDNSEMVLLQEKILKNLQEGNYFDSTIQTLI